MVSLVERMLELHKRPTAHTAGARDGETGDRVYG